MKSDTDGDMLPHLIGMLWGKQGLLGSHSWEGGREGDTSAFNCFDRSGIDNSAYNSLARTRLLTQSQL